MNVGVVLRYGRVALGWVCAIFVQGLDSQLDRSICLVLYPRNSCIPSSYSTSWTICLRLPTLRSFRCFVLSS